MESFYGGRQGSSFVIKRIFDCIDREKETAQDNIPNYMLYSCKYYKYNLEYQAFVVEEKTVGNTTKYTLIERTLDNEFTLTNQEEWKAIICDGKYLVTQYNFGIYTSNTQSFNQVRIETEDSNLQYSHTPILSEGMVDLFKQGGSTVNDVNYGEYVLISNANKNYPYNGRVYRRGMDYKNNLGGAEYIGTIVGPQGNAPELIFVNYDELEGEHLSNFSPKMIPGDDFETHENEFKVKYNTNKDKLNNVNQYEIGFQIPYNVFEFGATSVPYYDNFNFKHEDDPKDGKKGDKEKGNLFYDKYHFTFPRPIPGNDIDEIFIIDGYVKSGTPYYSDQACTQKVGELNKETLIKKIVTYDIKAASYHEIQINATTYYVKRIENNKSTMHKTVLYVKKQIYDVVKDKDNKTENGHTEYHYIGNYNIIQEVNLNKENGEFTVSYSCQDTYQTYLSWVKKIELLDNGEVKAFYTGKTETSEIINKEPIQWIIDAQVSTEGENEGEFTLTYNTKNKDNENNFQTFKLTWVNGLSLSEKGLLTAFYAGGEKQPVIVNENNPIKWIVESVIVDQQGLQTILNNQQNIENTRMPKIGDVLIRYNTSKTEDAHNQYFYYPINKTNNVQAIWTKVGEAQNLTGLKIYQVVDDLSEITPVAANAIPAGWGVFVPAKKEGETYTEAYIAIKNGYGLDYNNALQWPIVKISELGVGQTPELITPTNYATGVGNLEQELLFGKNTYIEKYFENNNEIIETSYCKEEDLIKNNTKYYKLKTTIYADENTKPTIDVIDNKLTKLTTDNGADYDRENQALLLKTGKFFNLKEGKLIMTAEHLIKEDILYLVTIVDNTTELREVLKKKAIEAKFPNNRTVIKEINTIIS